MELEARKTTFTASSVFGSPSRARSDPPPPPVVPLAPQELPEGSGPPSVGEGGGNGAASGPPEPPPPEVVSTGGLLAPGQRPFRPLQRLGPAGRPGYFHSGGSPSAPARGHRLPQGTGGHSTPSPRRSPGPLHRTEERSSPSPSTRSHGGLVRAFSVGSSHPPRPPPSGREGSRRCASPSSRRPARREAPNASRKSGDRPAPRPGEPPVCRGILTAPASSPGPLSWRSTSGPLGRRWPFLSAPQVPLHL